MAMYRTISMSFWTDSKVVDDFTPEDRYFYLYLFTNPHTNLCGCYEISIRQMAMELGYAKESVENLIRRFEQVHDVLRYSPITKEILLLNWHKYNWTKSEKFRVPLLKEIREVKETAFKEYLCEKAEVDKSEYGIDTICIDITNTNTNTNTVSEKKPRRFVAPSLAEVQDYCHERGNNVNAEQFIDYYQRQGWKLANGRPVVDWKACVRTWERNNYAKPTYASTLTPTEQVSQFRLWNGGDDIVNG